MPPSPSPQEIIASALALPAEDRLAMIDALHISLVDKSIDHGAIEPAAEVASAWSNEIAKRLANLEAGRVATVPADEAERLIRGQAAGQDDAAV